MLRHHCSLLAIASVGLGLATGACIGPLEYSCAGDRDCSPGTCQESGFCAFPDDSCHSGDRYGDHAAGDLAGHCVPVEPPGDLDDQTHQLLPAISADGPAFSARIYWSAGAAISSADIDGSNIVELVVDGEHDPAALAIDVDANRLYFATSAGSIQRINLDGSGMTELVPATAAATGLALDAGAGKLYFSASTSDRGSIHALHTDGSGLEELVGALDKPRRITIDTAAEHLYWADSGTGKIQRADTDGDKVRDLITGLGNPRDVVIAPALERIFFTDASNHSLCGAKLNGSSVVELVTGIDTPRGLSFDSEAMTIYWSDKATQLIQRAGSDGSAVTDILVAESAPRAIVLSR